MRSAVVGDKRWRKTAKPVVESITAAQRYRCIQTIVPCGVRGAWYILMLKRRLRMSRGAQQQLVCDAIAAESSHPMGNRAGRTVVWHVGLVPWQILPCVIHVHQARRGDLTHIAQALGLLRLDFRLGEGRQEERGQNRNNGHHHQKLRERKGVAMAAFSSVHLPRPTESQAQRTRRASL